MFTSISLFAIVKVLKRAGRWAVVPAILLASASASPAPAGIISTGSSVVFSGSSTTGLSARATFTVDPGNSNLLRLLLENTSVAPTMSPSELLTSVYFNVLSGTVTGSSAPLTYDGAFGNVYRTWKNKADELVTPVPFDLEATAAGDNTWQFRSGMSLVASQPPLAFGVGTVGNNSLAPNNFNGSIVDGFDFGIYVGDVTTQNLNNTLLVKNSARFTFAGFGAYNLAQVSPHVVFGFGTNPEVVITVPEPATLWLAGVGLLAALTVRRAPRSLLAACVVSAATVALLLALPPPGR